MGYAWVHDSLSFSFTFSVHIHAKWGKGQGKLSLVRAAEKHGTGLGIKGLTGPEETGLQEVLGKPPRNLDKKQLVKELSLCSSIFPRSISPKGNTLQGWLGASLPLRAPSCHSLSCS